MKTVSMKLSAADKKASMDGPVINGDGADYPYGLQLRLDTAQLDKLGLKGIMVGDECVIEAKGVVTMYREEATSGSKPECTAEIQITDLGVAESGEQKRSRASASHLDAISKPTSRY